MSKKDKKGEPEGPVVDIETAEDKLGVDLIAEIAEKDWKTAPLPSEEELSKETHKSPKARSNPNSRKNLVQYRDNKPTEVKEKIVKGLQFKTKREEVDPFDYIKLPADYDRTAISVLLPSRKVMKDAAEEKAFYRTFNYFLADFVLEALSSSDIQDIVSLAVNDMLEQRLLALSAADPVNLMDASATIEKFRKHSEKIKANLASRRSDRIDPRNKQNFSIVDLVFAYDDKKKEEFNERIRALDEEKKSYNSRDPKK